ncbi:MAG TPA: hypothetical protein VMV94_18580 [Phycisphaerae bacterium]|nr:hypothetical protein [Phycisphaerae bacterium]
MVGKNKLLDGMAVVGGEPCIFTGIDVNWAIRLDVQEGEKPLWFLKAGEPVTIVVHSPFHVFGRDFGEAVGETWQFSLTISRRNDGTLTLVPSRRRPALSKTGGFGPRD